MAAASRDRLPWQDALQPGDAIYSVNGRSVLDLDSLRAAVEAARGNRSAVLQIEGDGGLRYVVVPLD